MAAARALLAATLALAALPGSSRFMRAETGDAFRSAQDGPVPGDARPLSLFVSGHSLSEAPYPEHLARIVQSLGGAVDLHADNPFGTTAQVRARTLPARPAAHDLLIMTEQHTLLGNLLWNDTVGALGRLHRGLLAPGKQSFLFASWLDIADPDDPARWIAYERAADPVWRCVAARVSHDVAAQGGAVRPLPAALALAELVDRAGHVAVPGIGDGTSRTAIARLFRDSVHLTPLGAYYVALVSYSVVYGRTPEGAWAPETLDRASARGLQRIAWHFAESYRLRLRATAPGMRCRTIVARFVPHYLAYQRDIQWRDMGLAARYATWLRYRLIWPLLFRRQDARNPFFVTEAQNL